MNVAIIGSGIAGNVAAYKLRKEHDITVFEAQDYVGGHTNTVDVSEGRDSFAVDTGFIVFNDRTYPNFIQLLDEIGQDSQPSEMSFSVQAQARDFEFAGSSLDTLFAQRRNLLRPSFYRMIADILRFNETMTARLDASLDETDSNTTLGQLLDEAGYSREFVHHYLIPMTAAIWSAEPVAVLDMPVPFLVRFFANHGLLQLKDRPQWRVIQGGSREYVKKLVAGHADRVRVSSPVRSVLRNESSVMVQTDSAGAEQFDAVFLACHSDQALSLLADPTPLEAEVLGKIKYQKNQAILHTDVSLMPKRRKAWAAWNYHVPADESDHVAVTYNMNILQRLKSREQYCVTLNNDSHIDPSKILKRIEYEHPIFSLDMVKAQKRQSEINEHRTFYCGAYWQNGFHEDGVVSALNAVQHFEERHCEEQLHLRRAG